MDPVQVQEIICHDTYRMTDQSRWNNGTLIPVEAREVDRGVKCSYQSRWKQAQTGEELCKMKTEDQYGIDFNADIVPRATGGR